MPWPDAVTWAAAIVVLVLAVLGTILALLQRGARRWRIGVFYERDDDPPNTRPS